jgi:hypothetical protein
MSEDPLQARTRAANKFGLVRALPDREPTESEAPDQPAAVESTSVEEAETQAVGQTTTQRSRRKKAAAGPRPTTVSVPADLVPLWRERARHENVSQADVLFDAIEAHLDELTELISAEQTVPSGGLFERSKRRGKVLLAGVSLRLSASTDQALADLEREYGAASRSQLVTVALRRYLQSK